MNANTHEQEINNILESFPEDMIQRPQWVCWKSVREPGAKKPRKIPVNPRTGEEAKVNSPETWGSFLEAANRYKKSDTLAGVGFVFTEDDPYAGIDYDNCRNPETGELSKSVAASVERIGTYTEVSPSKTGVKLFGRGELERGKNLGNVEVYSSKRWFAVTGERLGGTPREARDIRRAIDSILAQAKAQANGAGEHEHFDTARAMAGVPEGERDSTLWSLAGKFRRADLPIDIAERNMLEAAANCNPPFDPDEAIDKVRRAYRSYPAGDPELNGHGPSPNGHGPSGSVRSPEDSQQDPDPLALGHTTPAPIHRYMLEGVEDPPILVDGLLYAGTKYPDGHTEGAVHTWYGEPGCGKSMVALWASIEVMRKGENVVYIDEEGTKRMITERLTGLGAAPEEIEAHFYYYNSPNLTTDTAHLKQLMNIAETLQPKLVIFDSWIDFLANDGRNENSSDEVIGWAMAVSKAFVNVGASVVLLDHVTKDGNGRGARGSGGKLGWVMVGHKVTVGMPFDRHSMGGVAFVRQKDREGALPARVTFAIGGDGTGDIFCLPSTSDAFTIPDAGLTHSARQALNSLPHDGLGFTEWWRASGIGGKTTFSTAVKKLTTGGFIRQDGSLYMPVTIGT